MIQPCRISMCLSVNMTLLANGQSELSRRFELVFTTFIFLFTELSLMTFICKQLLRVLWFTRHLSYIIHISSHLFKVYFYRHFTMILLHMLSVYRWYDSLEYNCSYLASKPNIEQRRPKLSILIHFIIQR